MIYEAEPRPELFPDSELCPITSVVENRARLDAVAQFHPSTGVNRGEVSRGTVRKEKRFPKYRSSEDPGFGKLTAQPCPKCRNIVMVQVEQGIATRVTPKEIPLELEVKVRQAGFMTYGLRRFASLAWLIRRNGVTVGTAGYPVFAEHKCLEDS
jgi:hypothetical protein